MQSAKVLREVDRSQERLATQEPIPARNVQQETDAPVSEVLVLYGRSQPDVDRPGISPGRKSPGQVRSFGEQQPIEIGRTLDECPQSLSKAVERAAPLENVRHRGAEHTSAPARLRGVLIPTERLVPVVVAEQPPWRLRTPDAVARALGPRFSVAVVACGRHLRATPPRVERVAGPFDRRVSCHATDALAISVARPDAGNPGKTSALRPRTNSGQQAARLARACMSNTTAPFRCRGQRCRRASRKRTRQRRRARDERRHARGAMLR